MSGCKRGDGRRRSRRRAVCMMLSCTPRARSTTQRRAWAAIRSRRDRACFLHPRGTHAVEADPRTDIKARADYVEKEAQSKTSGRRASRCLPSSRAPRPRRSGACGRATQMWSRLITSAALSTAACLIDESRFAAMLGSGEVLKGLELGLYDMCIGERRVLRVPPALAFGDRGSRAFGVPEAPRSSTTSRCAISLQYDPSSGGDIAT